MVEQMTEEDFLKSIGAQRIDSTTIRWPMEHIKDEILNQMERYLGIMELLNRINCIDKRTMREVLQVETWGDKTEFDNIWRSFQYSPYHGLGRLDISNLMKLFSYAEKDMI